MCRQAGYFEHASYLAKKYERHEDYLRIQIEDAGNFADALAYLRELGPEAVCISPHLFPFLNVDFFCLIYRLKVTLRDMGAPCSTISQKRPHNS